ncbi:MAG: histidinol-phosphate transaminase [Pseudomonadota bacterium]
MSQYERPNIKAMQGYTWGEQPDDDRTIKLNTNENPYPPSPQVTHALAQLDMARLRVYPQPTADPLRDVISNLHNLTRDQVIVTNGGDEGLRLALTTFVEPGAGFGMANPSYSLYSVLAQIQDANIVQVDIESDWSYPEDLAQQMNSQKVQLTCLVNPHAPSGTLHSLSQLSAIAAQLDGVLLIDEAYADFVEPTQNYDATQLLADHDNVLILRTFSKGYSLAGLRLGYLLGNTNLIDPLITKTRDSYNIDHISQALGVSALEDQAYAQDTWQRVREDRDMLAANLGQLGLHCPTSHTNFLLATVSEDAPLSAQQIYSQLKDVGVLIRYFDTPELNNKLRISIGTPEQNQILLARLSEFLNP